MDDPERVEVLKPFGDLQQLETLVRECTVYLAEVNTYQLGSRGIGVRLEVVRDVPIVTPVVDESKLEHRSVGNAVKGEDILVNQSLPDRRQFPKNPLYLLEILRWANLKSFNGHMLIVPGPPPNTGGSA